MSILATEKASGARGAVLLLQALGDKGGKRTRRLLAAAAVTQTVVAGAKAWTEKARNEHQFTVSVPGDDAIYADVHQWVLDRLPSHRRRAVTARTKRSSSGYAEEIPPGGSSRPVPSLRLFFDGGKTQTVTLDGHTVKVVVERPNWAPNGGDPETMSKWAAAEERIIFTATTSGGRDAVLTWLGGVAAAQANRQPRILLSDKWGNWMNRGAVAPRPLRTVILRAGQKERLLADMTEFLASEKLYADLGLPWHRGYLLHGVPGTGKTSIAPAIASHLGLDVYSIPLGSIDDDSRLVEAMTRVEPRSMLLLEDIDIARSSHTRDDTTGGVTLGGLLNALDGLSTPHGLITVMTTNNRDKLDPALIRPGRVDMDQELLPLDGAQFTSMCCELAGLDVGDVGGDLDYLVAERTPAGLVGVFKDHLGAEKSAIAAAVISWLTHG